jgi:hypothetical protein
MEEILIINVRLVTQLVLLALPLQQIHVQNVIYLSGFTIIQQIIFAQKCVLMDFGKILYQEIVLVV